MTPGLSWEEVVELATPAELARLTQRLFLCGRRERRMFTRRLSNSSAGLNALVQHIELDLTRRFGLAPMLNPCTWPEVQAIRYAQEHPTPSRYILAFSYSSCCNTHLRQLTDQVDASRHLEELAFNVSRTPSLDDLYACAALAVSWYQGFPQIGLPASGLVRLRDHLFRTAYPDPADRPESLICSEAVTLDTLVGLLLADNSLHGEGRSQNVQELGLPDLPERAALLLTERARMVAPDMDQDLPPRAKAGGVVRQKKIEA